MASSEEIVQKQLDAYNRKDVVGWLSTYSDDAVQYSMDGAVIAQGKDQIEKNIVLRFQEPDLYAELLERKVYEDVVIDHELITRNFPEGIGSVEMLCIYIVKNSLIVRGEFKVFGKKLTRLSN